MAALNFWGGIQQQLILAAKKIYAEEVEQAIKQHGDVVDVIVSSRPSERFGNEVVAVVQTVHGNRNISDELKACAGEHIARYKLPKVFVFVEEVKRGQNGKADYRWAKSIAESTIEEARYGS